MHRVIAENFHPKKYRPFVSCGSRWRYTHLKVNESERALQRTRKVQNWQRCVKSETVTKMNFSLLVTMISKYLLFSPLQLHLKTHFRSLLLKNCSDGSFWMELQTFYYGKLLTSEQFTQKYFIYSCHDLCIAIFYLKLLKTFTFTCYYVRSWK